MIHRTRFSRTLHKEGTHGPARKLRVPLTVKPPSDTRTEVKAAVGTERGPVDEIGGVAVENRKRREWPNFISQINWSVSGIIISGMIIFSAMAAQPGSEELKNRLLLGFAGFVVAMGSYARASWLESSCRNR